MGVATLYPTLHGVLLCVALHIVTAPTCEPWMAELESRRTHGNCILTQPTGVCLVFTLYQTLHGVLLSVALRIVTGPTGVCSVFTLHQTLHGMLLRVALHIVAGPTGVCSVFTIHQTLHGALLCVALDLLPYSWIDSCKVKTEQTSEPCDRGSGAMARSCPTFLVLLGVVQPFLFC